MSYTIHWGGDPEDIMVVLAGPASSEDVGAALAEITAAPWYRSGLRVLWDHRAVDWTHVTAADMQRRAEVLIRYSRPDDNHRAAIVVDRKLPYGLLRIRSAYTEGRMTTVDRLFYDLESARDWLQE